MTVRFIPFINFSILISIALAALLCSEQLKPKRREYYPLRHCQRSNLTQIGVKNVENVTKCAQFAERNNAMAFNYGHGKKPKNRTFDGDLVNLFDITNKTINQTKIENEIIVQEMEPYFNCILFDCPEIGNLSKMMNDSRYDYYSMYANPIRKYHI